MCGRIVITTAAEAIRRLFGTTNATINLAPSWNVAPTQQHPVIRRHPDSGDRQLDLLRWDLVPHFTKDLKATRRLLATPQVMDAVYWRHSEEWRRSRQA